MPHKSTTFVTAIFALVRAIAYHDREKIEEIKHTVDDKVELPVDLRLRIIRGIERLLHHKNYKER